MNILITGSNGFIGKHLVEVLRREPNVALIACDVDSPAETLSQGLREADLIFHLAGVNRPQHEDEFEAGNADLTRQMCAELGRLQRRPLFVLSSSIQAALDNPYGRSKRAAEEALQSWAASGGGRVVLLRLKNVFGKWCRPNYNSVVATFCHQIARDLPITISDPARELELVYIDDVIAEFVNLAREAAAPTERGEGNWAFREVPQSYRLSLGELAGRLRQLRASRQSLIQPSMEDEFTRRLYATFLSYLEGPDFAYALQQRTDPRGSLAEFMKSASFGQIFVSRTRPGITRGHHYHHTKTEKFLVVEGDAVIRFRHILGHELIEHRVSGHEFKVVDIPPGYTHSIENVGSTEMVTLFWASEVFDPTRPDTFPLNV